MSNALELVGKTYHGMPTRGYHQEDVIHGATYLLSRDYEESRVVTARLRSGTHKQSVVLGGSRYYSTLVNPPVMVGDQIIPLEAQDDASLRRDQIRVVTEVRDDGVMATYAGGSPRLITHWVLWGDGNDGVKDKHNPKRRELVLQRLTDEGMHRAYETGYATSAREFFDRFELPKPAVEPVAFINVTRDMVWRDMPYDLRREFERGGVESLRTAVLKGRIKITLPKQECRRGEITMDEVKKQFTKTRNDVWTVGELHKVECMWCTQSGGMPGQEDL